MRIIDLSSAVGSSDLEAVRIAMAANPSAGAATSIYDHDLSKFVALSSDGRDNPRPFEWSVVSRPGISTMIVPRSDSGQLQIRWNGLGALRSEVRRVGTGCASKFRARWSPFQ